MVALSSRLVLGGAARLPGARCLLALVAVSLGSIIVTHGLIIAAHGPVSAPSGAGSAQTPTAPALGTPTSLQVAAQAAIGEATPRFLVRRRGAAFIASGAGVASRFGIGGARITVPGGDVGMRLEAVGYGTALAGVPRAVAPAAAGAHVRYRRGPVVEWYRNGPFGLEQGFTLARRPTRHGTGPLTLALALDGSLTPRSTARGVDFVSPSGAVRLRYRALLVTDATGRELSASLAPAKGGLLVRIIDRHARYPVVVDPIMQLGTKLIGSCAGSCTGPNGTGSDGGEFGVSVALSGDGATALIGAPFATPTGSATQTGAAWVFTRDADGWSQQGAPLIGSCTTGCGGARGTGMVGNGRFGFDVALSRDGDTALIGALADDSGNGAAWVFTRTDGSWSQQGAKLVGDCTGVCSGPNGTGSSGAGANFGTSVALSDDGNTAVITAMGQGSAWVFTRSAGGWSQQGPNLLAPLPSSGSPILGFGISSALSGDGDTAVIGSPDVGNAVVYVRANGAWTLQAVLNGSCNSITQTCGGPQGTGGEGTTAFGTGVALSRDGNTALIGGEYDGLVDAGNLSEAHGAAWVFTRTGGAWEQQGPKLVPNCTSGCGGPNGTGAVGGEAGTTFGASVALSDSGDTALIGGPTDGTYEGAAWLFTRSGGVWSQASPKLVGNCKSDCEGANGTGETDFTLGPLTQGGAFGRDVALDGGGHTGLIGAFQDDANKGAVWSFALDTKTLTVTVTGSGAGTVIGPGINCPGKCTITVPYGTAVTLNASPAAGVVLKSWSGGCSGTGPCTLTLTADTTVSADFEPPPPAAKPKARCALKGPVRKVNETSKTAGKLSVTVTCDQAVSVTLVGRVTSKHGKKTKAFTLKPVRSSARALAAKSLTIKLPRGALMALKRKGRTSLALALTVSNANGRVVITKRVPRLVAAR